MNIFDRLNKANRLLSAQQADDLFCIDIDELRAVLGIEDLLAAVEPEVAREHVGDAAAEGKVDEIAAAEELHAQHDAAEDRRAVCRVAGKTLRGLRDHACAVLCGGQ